MKKRVYFIKPIGMDGPIKIGCSEAPDNRLSVLMAWSPFELELIGSVEGDFEDERFLHSGFANLHTHREWFEHSKELRAAIEKVIASGSVDVLKGSLTPKGTIRARHGRKWTQDQKLRASYNSRIWHAKQRLRDTSDNWRTPEDVERIIERWRGSYHRRIESRRPTDAEFARLDEYLRDPESHSVSLNLQRNAA